MPVTDPLPGARWVRAALQVNPYEYKGKNQPSTSFSSELITTMRCSTNVKRSGSD